MDQPPNQLVGGRRRILVEQREDQGRVVVAEQLLVLAVDEHVSERRRSHQLAQIEDRLLCERAGAALAGGQPLERLHERVGIAAPVNGSYRGTTHQVGGIAQALGQRARTALGFDGP